MVCASYLSKVIWISYFTTKVEILVPIEYLGDEYGDMDLVFFQASFDEYDFSLDEIAKNKTPIS